MTMMDDMRAAVFDVHAEMNGRSVVYTPAGGAGASITAIVANRRGEELTEEDGRTAIEEVEITIANDASEGVASPQIGDGITIGTEDFAVVTVLERGGAVHRVAARKRTLLERSGPSHRRRF